MDVQLAAGHSPDFSLAKSARELREKAKNLMRQASIMDEAASYLANQNKNKMAV
jgi:hypothetical protein